MHSAEDSPLSTSKLDYTLRATLPVKTTTMPAIAYEYYSPDVRSESGLSNLIVLGK